MKRQNNSKQSSKEEKVSKLQQFDENNLDEKTIPNAVVMGGLDEIGLYRLSPFEIPHYLLMHPVLDRGIQKNSHKILKFGHTITPNPKGGQLSDEVAEYCKDVLESSDTNAHIFLSKIVKGAWRFGTSRAVLQLNKKGDEAVRFEHQSEIFFGPSKYPSKYPEQSKAGKLKINPKTKRVAYFTQFQKKYPEQKQSNNQSGTYVDTRRDPRLKTQPNFDMVPVGDEISSEYVSELWFDSISDEPMGIPLAQWVHLTIKYMMNMERAGAQTQVNYGFNKWVANTPFTSQSKMQAFGASLNNIHSDAVVVLPEGVSIENKAPSTTDFQHIHPIYMRLVAIRLGIPLPLLTMDGSSTNKATVGSQQEDYIDDIFNYQVVVEGFVQDLFFKAVKIKYGKGKTVKEILSLVPDFKFNESPADIDKVIARLQKESLIVRNYALSAEIFDELGMDDVVDNIIERVKKITNFNYLDKPERFPNFLADNPLGKKTDKKPEENKTSKPEVKE